MTRYARNQARYRARQRDGLRVFALALPEHQVAELLGVCRLIGPHEVEDVGKLRRGLEQLLREQLNELSPP